ncbi:MAG: OmpA family protein [Crocinitomicaceae bacterium]|nr:OmpA family protein [Crocinitomicaceae bacterium]
MISDCEGAISLINSGKNTFQLIGNGGDKNEFKNYPSLSEYPEANSVWFKYTAPFDGSFNLRVESYMDPIKMVVFDGGRGDINCEDIYTGKAEIQRFFVEDGHHILALGDSIGGNVLAPIRMRKNNSVIICVYAQTKKKGFVKMNLDFTPALSQDLSGTGRGAKKVIDERVDEFQACVHVQVRDVETMQPVIGVVKLEGIRGVNGSYKASELFLTQKQSGKLQLHCDALGYFYIDRDEQVFSGAFNEINLWMEPIKKGKSLVLNDIQFKPGTAQFLPSAEAKLIRLKDFMVLNPRIDIEIQGHVLELEEKTNAGKVLSEARAKQVAQYLIESGIKKNRIETRGFGGTRPVFENPTNAEEEQANRRVEILIL